MNVESYWHEGDELASNEVFVIRLRESKWIALQAKAVAVFRSRSDEVLFLSTP